ncbi:hypothetical protein CRI77_12145 [Mycolicibacterium duvalii]|uniref:Uncharacterized protein n=1 Tax=Mycolicibacterium duvalii TaxID=39688 RepID=A0A7I7K9C8_9MYCO|nr:hypothetical protein [Mycolicibacterium duvalii]MCV7366271.1 hypothetical protein [Mycolicibacterium duvalii]PEG41046.1 hypothetical protein CRI77_12145 [Mycolicibacterium duvalii]BBX20098.1 hypothetical protein MDUV_49580 [Mycolicibacterium duvalii]
MSSSEPPPADDDDTGPLRPASRPDTGVSGSRYDAPLSVNPRPVQRDRRPLVVVGAATVAVIALGVLAWSFWPSSDEPQTSEASEPATTSPTVSQPEAENRVLSLVPRGYPADACAPVVPPKGALAQVSCGPNTDPGGPLAATYTLARDSDALTELFDEVVDTSSVVNCPNNIQSPGPWRRNATPDQVAGTLVCGFQQNRPTVAWTTTADRLLSEVHSGPQGPNMVQLYTWWSSHS